MSNTYCKPMVEVTRGDLVESIHFGALAIIDSEGRHLASVGDDNEVLYLRSASKPFQTIPLVEMGGVEKFGLTEKELAITCASHKGTDDHVATLMSMHEKIGVTVDDLQCGIHAAGDRATYDAMVLRGEEPNAFRHNCSGKHTGMLGQIRLSGAPFENYVNQNHPIQQRIIHTFAEMLGMTVEEVVLGIDGCSVPVFGVPLWRAAYGYARLCDPKDLEPNRAEACRKISSAMMAFPEMVCGPSHCLDTSIMKACKGKVIAKGGADGYQSIGIMPNARFAGSPGIGITYKIADGDDASSRARGAIAAKILTQLGLLDENGMEVMSEFAERPIYNVRNFQVGEIRCCFNLELTEG